MKAKVLAIVEQLEVAVDSRDCAQLSKLIIALSEHTCQNGQKTTPSPSLAPACSIARIGDRTQKMRRPPLAL